KNVHVWLSAKGRALKAALIPLAEDVNRISVAGVATEDVITARRVLLAILDNLARDEAAAGEHVRRLPSTRELSSLPARRRS
ncbi:MAG: MarR family transcriptional regulator, partial [Betaproteobacteria bacterium]